MSMQEHLNKIAGPFFENLEKELSKNCIKKDLVLDLGDVYHITAVTNLLEVNNKEIVAGGIKDLMIKKDDAKTNKIRTAIGFVYGHRIVQNNDPNMLTYLSQQLILSFKKVYGFGPETPHYGTYISFKNPEDGTYFKVAQDVGGFEITATGNAIPVVDLNVLKELQ